MNKQDFLKTQSCVLRLNIDCDGCKAKIKKLLQKIDGVYTVNIDTQQGKVTVTGNVDPSVLIKKLEKHGKHAELWGSSKGSNNNQFKNLHFDGAKMGKPDNNNNNNKSQKGGGGKEQQKGGGGAHQQHQQLLQQHQQLLQQQMKGTAMIGKDFKMPNNKMKDQKSVKFDLPEDDEFDDDDDDDEFDDDQMDDEFDDECDDDDHGHGHGHHHHPSSKNIPIKGNEKKGKSGKKGKKSGGGGGGGVVGLFKGMLGGGGGGGRKSDVKKKDKGIDGKKDGENIGSIVNKHQNLGHGGGFEGKIGKPNGGGGGGFGGKMGKAHGGGFEGKSGKAHGGNVINHKGINSSNNGKNNNGGGKKGSGGNFHENDGMIGKNGHGGPTNMAMMGHNMGLPSGQPMMNGGGGYHQGMGPGPGPVPVPSPNPYGNNPQQQQYMAMMMNQQRMNGGDGYGMYQQPQPMMYGRPPMGMPYGPPMVPPPAYNDPFTSYFSDENTNSCSIM